MISEPMRQSLGQIRVVMIETSHPGNIGAAARAMKTMCLSDLVLVNPKHFPDADATARASGADDILARATVTHTLDEAIADCHLVVGASARIRHLEWSELGPRAGAERLIEAAGQGPVAVLFGREHSGLTNTELERCQHLLHIPSNPQYSSLNIAAAIQVMCYELYSQALGGQSIESPAADDRPATASEFQGFFEHFTATLEQIDFLQAKQSTRLLRRLRRLYDRAGLNRTEVNILRGILTAINKKTNGE